MASSDRQNHSPQRITRFPMDSSFAQNRPGLNRCHLTIRQRDDHHPDNPKRHSRLGLQRGPSVAGEDLAVWGPLGPLPAETGQNERPAWYMSAPPALDENRGRWSRAVSPISSGSLRKLVLLGGDAGTAVQPPCGSYLRPNPGVQSDGAVSPERSTRRTFTQIAAGTPQTAASITISANQFPVSAR